MNKTIKIRDLTLRDGQQSLLATRMNQSQIDRLLPYYREANFYALEVWGGAVPDSVMRYLKENPWDRLEKIKNAIGNTSKLTALSRGRNLFGYNPYPEEVIEGFCRNAVKSGIDIMRIFDALNDTTNLASSIKYVKQNGGIADGAVCFTVDPKLPPKEFLFGLIKIKRKFTPFFTTDYFLKIAKEIEELGADMISIKDMAGLIKPSVTKDIITRLKKEISLPIDFHTHCTPGYGLASVLTAIIYGADIVDTSIWYFAGGPAAPAYELIHIFCKKLGIETNVNIEAVEKINNELYHIRKELEKFDSYKIFPKQFNLTNYSLPKNIELLFDKAIEAAINMNEKLLLQYTNEIEKYFGFPEPDDKVRDAEIPGGMYTNMLAQLKELGLEHLLDKVLKTVPIVRIDAGCPPLVTPTSQIVGVQAVNCVIDENKGLPRYTTKNTQFVNLVKGSYGKTPLPINPQFRLKIAGTEKEIPYDTSNYKKQDNPPIPELENRRIAENEKDELLLELFPNVANQFLRENLENQIKAKKEEEKRKQEEEFLREKLAYESLTPEQKRQRLIEGLYKYAWFTYLPQDSIDEIIEDRYLYDDIHNITKCN